MANSAGFFSLIACLWSLFFFAVIVSPFLYDKYPLSVIPQPDLLSAGSYYPPLVWDTGLFSNFFNSESEYKKSAASPPSPDAKPLDLTSLSSEEEDGKTSSDPPSPASSAIEAEKFHCSQCTKSYSTFAGLSKHRQLHCDSQTRKSFSCKYCEKEYVSLGALKMHIRSHTLPCVCKICGKAFSRPWLLQGHIRTHTGKAEFFCLCLWSLLSSSLIFSLAPVLPTLLVT